MTVPTRPGLRWHGGKWKLAPWILGFFPPHEVYVEPFGGAASVLLRKSRSAGEVYNDLDDEVVSLFRVLQDAESCAELLRLLRVTPFARREFERSYEPADNPVEQSRRLIIRSYMGFGSNAHASTARGHRSTGFRANAKRSGTTPAQDWANYPDCLAAIVTRFAGVTIEHRDALAVMRQHDGSATLHYVDPPYMHGLRAPSNKYDLRYRMYRHEIDDAGHAALLDALRELSGMVVLSGYPSPVYDAALTGWRRAEKATFADGARARTEVLWLNPLAADRLGAPGLFDGVAA